MAKRRKPARQSRARGSRPRTRAKRKPAKTSPRPTTRRAKAPPSLRTKAAPSRKPRELTAAERLRQKLAIQFAMRLKERQRRKRKLSRTPEYADLQYLARLKTVQRYVEGFDTKQYRELLKHTPRTAAGKAKRRALRAKVNRVWNVLRPYVVRPQKTVRFSTKQSEKALRKYAAFPRIKGLKAVPVSTAAPEKTRIKVDRKGRVNLYMGKRYHERLDLFPRAPVDPDDMLDMAERMIEEELPMGYYLIVTSHHDLLPTIAHRDQLMDELRMLIYQYRDESGFLAMVRGFKWLGHTREAAQKYQLSMSAARRNAFSDRRNAFDEIRKQAAQRRKQKRRADKSRCPKRNEQGAQCVLERGHFSSHRFRHGTRRI